MDKLKELLKALGEIDAKIDALLAHDELTAEQQAEHDKLVAERNKTKQAVTREQERLAREEERAALEKTIADRDAKLAEEERVAKGLRGKNAKTTADDPEDLNPGAKKAATKGIPATVKRYGNLKNFQGVRGGREADERAYRFGMWALAELSRQMPNRYSFENAVKFFEENKGVWGAAHQSNNASGVHNLIPEEFGADLILLRESYGVVRRLFLNVPMMSDTRTDPRQQGGLTAYFVGESSAGTESNATYDNVRLTARKLMVLARMSSEASEDAAINLGDRLIGEISYAFANKEDSCGLLGDGTSTYGHIQGVNTKLLDVDGSGTDSAGVVVGTGNAYSELVLGDFDRVVGKLPQFADTPLAAWVMHRAFYYGVVEKLVQASGGVPAYEVRDGERRPRPIFKGYPVEFSQVMPSTEANSQICALLGDFTLGASFGDRAQESIAFSEHATIGGENVFERDQVAIRGTERFDINVHDVGSSSEAGPIVGLQTASS